MIIGYAYSTFGIFFFIRSAVIDMSCTQLIHHSCTS